jgi:hypothetical protein
MRPTSRAALLAVALLAPPLAEPLDAQPVHYTFTGLVSGTYAGTPFSNVQASFAGSNDPALNPPDPTGADITWIDGLSFTAALPGVVTGTFDDPVRLFVSGTG